MVLLGQAKMKQLNFLQKDICIFCKLEQEMMEQVPFKSQIP